MHIWQKIGRLQNYRKVHGKLK